MKVNLFSEAEMINNFGEGIWAVYRQQSKGLEDAGAEVIKNKTLFDDSDVVHIHSFGPLSYAKASLTRKPLVISTHTLPDEAVGSVILSKQMSKLFSFYLPHFYSKADVLVAPSEFTKKSLAAHKIKNPIHVVSNGVDTKKFTFSQARRAAFRREYGIRADEVVVYGVGQVIIRKGVDKFIRLAREFPDVKFVWVGRRPFGHLSGNNKELSELIDNAPKNVIFTGFVDDIVGAHSAGDIFLMPTIFENECIALLEACAAGRAPVVSNIDVFSGWMNVGENCLIAGSMSQYRQAIRRLVKSREMRKRLGANARKTAKERDIKLVSKKLIDIYSKTEKKRRTKINISVEQKAYLLFAFSLIAAAGSFLFIKDRLVKNH